MSPKTPRNKGRTPEMRAAIDALMVVDRVLDRTSDAPALTGPPCEWPHGHPSTWPDKLEEIPRCPHRAVAVGRRSTWDEGRTIAVCAVHDALAASRESDRFGVWSSEPWKPEMVRGRDGT